MSLPSQLPIVGEDEGQWALLSAQSSSYLLLICTLTAMLLYTWSLLDDTMKSIPYVNPTGLFSSAEAKRNFWASGASLVAQLTEKYPNQICRLMTEVGERITLPPHLVDEICNKPNMSFLRGFQEDFHGRIPGYEPVLVATDSDILVATIKKHMVKINPNTTKAMSDEAGFILSKAIGDSPDWHEMELLPVLFETVSRMTTRVFLGEEYCGRDDWITMMRHYQYNWFFESPKLHRWPQPLRRFIHWTMPGCKALRAQLEEARRILSPTMTKRREMKQAALAAGQEAPKLDDVFEWLEEEAKARGLVYDEALVTNFCIAIGLFSLHTTSDSLKKMVVHFAHDQDFIQSAREEIIQQLQAEGMSKASFYKMQLLDSAMKESQRMYTFETVMLRRRVEKDTQLSNGLVLKEGTRTVVNMSRMRDPAAYENPDQWDPARFLKLRSQPDKKKMAPLESPSLDHIGFGYGNHACPGRFFATNILKVVLCHLLVKYEWKLSPGIDSHPVALGTALMANPAVRFMIRRREKVEIDIDSI